MKQHVLAVHLKYFAEATCDNFVQELSDEFQRVCGKEKTGGTAIVCSGGSERYVHAANYKDVGRNFRETLQGAALCTVGTVYSTQ